MTLPLHPLAEIFPPIAESDFTALVESIKAHGLREPVTLYEHAIIDGRNRARACEVAGVQVSYHQLPLGVDPLQYVIDKNLNRRHLDASQRAMVAAKLATLKRGDNQHSPIGETSQARAAELLNVGKRSVERAADVRDRGAPELVSAVERGEVSVSAAAGITDLPEAEQREAVTSGKNQVVATAKQIKKAKRRKKGKEAGPPQDDLSEHLARLNSGAILRLTKRGSDEEYTIDDKLIRPAIAERLTKDWLMPRGDGLLEGFSQSWIWDETFNSLKQAWQAASDEAKAAFLEAFGLRRTPPGSEP